MEFLDEKKLGKEKLKAMELTEDSRETEWSHPSFAAEIFKGNVCWDLLCPFPTQSPEEKKIGDAFLQKLEEVLKTHIDPDAIDQTGEIPKSALDALAQIGCFAMKVPKEYGGQGLSQVNYNRAIHLVASYCGATTVLLSAHQSIGVPQPLKMFGNEEQKKKYLPRFAQGAVSAFALTEPDVGSDPAKMKTTAVPSEDGQSFTLNGEKLWCTNGPIADIMIVMAQTPPKVVNGREKKQITAFIVEKEMPGVACVHRCEFMGLRGMQNGLMRFTNVKVPRENILLGEGKGLKLALTTLNTGRLTLPAAVTGGAKYGFRTARLWAKERIQWGAPIGEHELIGSKLAEMAATLYAMDAVNMLCASMADQGKTDIRLEAAMAKLFCTESAWRITDDVMQIRGGRGYETAKSLRGRGEKAFAVERLMRDMRINTIIEGTSQILQLFMAREAMDVHVKKMIPIVSSKTPLMKRMHAIIHAMGFYSVWYPKQWLPRTGLPTGEKIPRVLKPHMRFIGNTAKRLSRALFHAMMVYQARLEKKQNLMARLMNIGTDLFAMSAVCSMALSSKASTKGVHPDGIELASLFCALARLRIRREFESTSKNHDFLNQEISRQIMKAEYSIVESDMISE